MHMKEENNTKTPALPIVGYSNYIECLYSNAIDFQGVSRKCAGIIAYETRKTCVVLSLYQNYQFSRKKSFPKNFQ